MANKPKISLSQQPSLNIAFFGTPRFAQIVLEKLINSPYKPSIVITAPDTKSGRGQQIKSSPVKQTAEKYGIKILQPTNLSSPEFSSQLSTVNCQLSLLVAYGKIIPKEILKIPKYGFINVHPSLLPKYRGPSPIQSAILSGEKETGVTIMLLDEEIDHGPILAQKEIMVESNDNNEVLHEKLGKIGAELLIKILPEYLNGNLKPAPQNHKDATFTNHITRKDGYIDPNNPPDKITIERMIRAFHPWPGVYTDLRFKNKDLRIKLLPGGKIQPQGKNPMTIREFLNGYPQVKEQIRKLHLI